MHFRPSVPIIGPDSRRCPGLLVVKQSEQLLLPNAQRPVVVIVHERERVVGA